MRCTGRLDRGIVAVFMFLGHVVFTAITGRSTCFLKNRNLHSSDGEHASLLARRPTGGFIALKDSRLQSLISGPDKLILSAPLSDILSLTVSDERRECLTKDIIGHYIQGRVSYWTVAVCTRQIHVAYITGPLPRIRPSFSLPFALLPESMSRRGSPWGLHLASLGIFGPRGPAL